MSGFNKYELAHAGFDLMTMVLYMGIEKRKQLRRI
jgi:hypothetical protein